jgi:hypothetical protein
VERFHYGIALQRVGKHLPHPTRKASPMSRSPRTRSGAPHGIASADRVTSVKVAEKRVSEEVAMGGSFAGSASISGDVSSAIFSAAIKQLIARANRRVRGGKKQTPIFPEAAIRHLRKLSGIRDLLRVQIHDPIGAFAASKIRLPRRRIAVASDSATLSTMGKMRWLLLVLAVVTVGPLVSCLGPRTTTAPTGLTPASPSSSSVNAGFANPQPVTIEGYSGPQQDPVISPDGLYLFFDSHNDDSSSSSLYWARRINYKTFKFMGEIQGVNFPGEMTLRGNYDLAHNFFFVSSKFRTYCGMIAQGVFRDGTVSNITPVKGICAPPPRPGDINVTFDVAITPDGKTLYYTDATFNRSGPQTARIAMAAKNADGSFTRHPDSDTLFKNVNGLGPLVFNSTPTPDGLAFFFTPGITLRGSGGIYIAKRSSTVEPFGIPARVTDADNITLGGFPEMGAISPDGIHLYFHRVLSKTSSQIYVLMRVQKQ